MYKRNCSMDNEWTHYLVQFDGWVVYNMSAYKTPRRIFAIKTRLTTLLHGRPLRADLLNFLNNCNGTQAPLEPRLFFLLSIQNRKKIPRMHI